MDLQEFLGTCHIHLFFVRSRMLDERDREVYDSPFRMECFTSESLAGAYDLDDEDTAKLVQAWGSQDVHGFLRYIRRKYQIENVSNYQLYLRLKARETRSRQKRETISPAAILKVFRRDHFKCQKCGQSDDLTIDHIKPWIDGGNDDPSNLQTLCQSCNSRKGAP